MPPNLEWDAARTAAEQLADWFPGFKPPSAPHVHHDGERARPDSEVLLDADGRLSPSLRNSVQQSDAPNSGSNAFASRSLEPRPRVAPLEAWTKPSIALA